MYSILTAKKNNKKLHFYPVFESAAVEKKQIEPRLRQPEKRQDGFIAFFLFICWTYEIVSGFVCL
nr:MAG TPA: hypothetical protein [Caudoviricetes sp.]